MKSKILLKYYRTSNFALLLLLLTTISSFSQSNHLVERSNYIHILSGNPANLAKVKAILNLMDGVNSSVYLSDGQVRTYGQNPVCLYSDVSSVGMPIVTTAQKSSIEMVTIKIDNPSQLNSIINFSSFTSYKTLKYIYFRIGFDINLSQLNEAIKNATESYVIIYSIEKGA